MTDLEIINLIDKKIKNYDCLYNANFVLCRQLKMCARDNIFAKRFCNNLKAENLGKFYKIECLRELKKDIEGGILNEKKNNS